MTQLFLFNFYYKKLEKQYISDLKNRVYDVNYKYTFAKKKIFNQYILIKNIQLKQII